MVFSKHIILPEQFRHIIVIVNQSLTSDQKMNWRYFVGVFFLVATTVLVLNIGLFIHISMQKQVFIMCRSDKKLSPFAHHQSGQNQIGYPGEREITLPSCAKVSGPKSLPDSLRFVAFDKSNIICLWLNETKRSCHIQIKTQILLALKTHQYWNWYSVRSCDIHSDLI